VKADKTKVPHTLLLADDSVTIQRVIELTFADEDVRVVAVGDGDQAIAMLDQTPPDIVLADIGMPGRDGYQVAQHIRDTPELAHIPVVLLTGAFEPVDQARAEAVGCDGVLAKPFEPQQVIGRVKELLARPKGSAAAETGPLIDDFSFHRGEPKASEPFGAESYFDRLDQALADATSGSRTDFHPPAAAAGDIDWFSPLPPAAVTPVAPRVPVEPSAPLEARVPEPPAAEPPAVQPAVEPPLVELPPGEQPPAEERRDGSPRHEAAARDDSPASAAVAFPPLAEAFSALLAAEESAPTPPAAPVWPPPAPPAVEITDELIERIVGRVLDRLTDRVVRDSAADIVSQVAERLVREEIDRIKKSLKAEG
jgi:CheY-like chemotaxis protein